MKYYCEDTDRVLGEVESAREGLSSAEAAKRLERDGPNRLEAAKGKSLLRRFFEQLADPMIIILLVAAAVSGVLAVVEGESFADVIIILAVVLINAVLGVYQENKAEKAVEALQKMSAATSRVLRDGKVVVIPSEELVVGDVVLLEAGDAVPADGRVLESASLKSEEAALTGESLPVNKFIDLIRLEDTAKDIPLGDRKNMVYMGSTIVYGRGVAVVTATGMDTEMGKIAGALTDAKEGKTPLADEAQSAVQDLNLVGAGHLRGGVWRSADPRRADQPVLGGGFLYGGCFPGRCRDPGGIGRRGHGGAVHRCDQYVPSDCHYSQNDGGGNAGLRPDHLL